MSITPSPETGPVSKLLSARVHTTPRACGLCVLETRLPEMSETKEHRDSVGLGTRLTIVINNICLLHDVTPEYLT